MSSQIAHNIEEKARTADIHINENVDFEAMLLSDTIVQGLKKSGFKKPSPIQLKGIPMGRFGYDLIIKAKSGTGKTAVFGIIALEMINVQKNALQVIILAPTREIAVQIQQVILTIGTDIEGLNVNYFIGGTPLQDDIKRIKNCHIAVAAPGRMNHLLKVKATDLENVRLFVLDEADKLMTDSFQKDINQIYNKLPEIKQIIASSATYPNELDTFLTKYMISPVHVSLDTEMPVLLGLKQFVTIVKSHLNVLQQIFIKTEELIRILSKTSFTQCMIFSNYQTRAESLSNNLIKLGWPSAFISAAQKQETRLKTVSDLKEFKCRVLVTTDLTARGIDAANVDLVINIDVPYDFDTYLHRMGRAGRYGSRGICITVAAEGKDVENLQKILGNIGGNRYSIPHYPKTDAELGNIWECDVTNLEQFCAIKNKSDSEISSEVVCAELKDLSVNEKNVIDKTINELKTTAEDNNTEELVSCIDMLLDNLNKEDEKEKVEIREKYNNLDTNVVIGNLFENSKNSIDEDAVIKKSKNKKIKTDEVVTKETPKSILCDKQKIISPDKNKQFNSQAKLFQENIFNKNVSLYNITKYLVEQNVSASDEYENSIDKLLNIISEEDNFETNKLKENCTAKMNISDILRANSSTRYGLESCADSENENKNVVNVKEIVEKQKLETNLCECSENICIDAYNYATTISNKHWKKSICNIHLKENETAMEYLNENDNAMDKDDYYNYDEEYFVTDQDTTSEVDEDIFVKAYDYAVRNIGKKPHISESFNENSEDFNNEAFGYAADFSHPSSRDEKYNKRKYLKHTSPIDEYESKFNYYTDLLSQKAPYFTTVEDFENYFAGWKLNVSCLKEIIHEDVYSKELLALTQKDKIKN